MVVSFDDENKKALLSLRQTEILMKLQSVTLDPELEKRKPANWYVLPSMTQADVQRIHPNLSPGIRTIHVRIDSRMPLYRIRKRLSFRRGGYAISTSNHSITPQTK
jgi:hypothetical protein